MKKKLLDIGTKVKYSETWLNSTGLARKRWRGMVTAHYKGEDPTPFVYVLWNGQENTMLANCHNLTAIKEKGATAVKKPEPKSTITIPDLKSKDIAQLAKLILKDWPVPNYAAAPYLNAMTELKTVNDKHWHDSAENIILRFLSNSSSWRGDMARAIKAELRLRLKIGA
jgi:hypothetical protein